MASQDNAQSFAADEDECVSILSTRLELMDSLPVCPTTRVVSAQMSQPKARTRSAKAM